MRAALQGSPITDRSLVYVQIGVEAFLPQGEDCHKLCKVRCRSVDKDG